MNKKTKITLVVLSLFLLAVVGIVLGIISSKSNTAFGEYSYQSSLRQFETVENIVLDGKRDDSVWEKITPYVRKTKAENRDASKYAHLASRVDECKVEVYTYLGEEGLFVYATTDDPVVNTTIYNPFGTTAFDFYLASRDVLSRIDNLFELGITPSNTARLRVRNIDANTKKETWKYIPCVGLKSEAIINEKGYSVEFFVPWSTFNMEAKPEYLSMATALSRRVDESKESERYWEMLDANTESIGFVNYTTYPLFDKTGYVEFAKGENFEFVHSSIIDFSKDKGDNPSVSTLNISTVSAFLEMDPVKDVYWETTVKINDFNYTDDPRIGIMLKGEKKEDKSFDRVYLMLQLDKDHKGEGYTIKNALMLPSNSKEGNDWKKSQTYLLDSHVKNKEFKLAVLKQSGKFYFYLDDVLLSIRDDIKDFDADSKVTCGIVSWYAGATFSDYNMATSGLNAIKNKKTDIFVADGNYTNIRMDMLTEAKGYIWADTEKTNQSTIHFNQSLSKNFYLTTTLSDVKPYKDAADSRNGIVLTKDINGGYRRLVFAMMASDIVNFSRLQIIMFDNDDLGENWTKVTNIDSINFSARKDAELSIAVTGNIVKVYIDEKFATAISLADYGMQNPTKVGLTSWKGKVKFSNISLTTETKDSSTLVTDVNASRTVLPLMESEATNVYAEANITVSDTSTSMWPRVGLRLRNAAGENVDYVLSYDKTKNLLYAVVVRVNVKGADVSEQQCYAITSAEASIPKTGIKLAAAKVGGTISFYANDVLLGTKTYEGFGASDAVTARLYSKGTASTFTNYSAIIDKAEIEKIIAVCADTFIPDPNKIAIKFDLLNEENEKEPKITTNENGAWAKSSIVNWNGVLADKFYTETTIELTGNNNKDGTVASAGMVLTNGDNRFFILLSGDEKEIIRLQCVSMTKDVFDGYNAEKFPNGKVYECSDKVSLTGEVKLAVYRDGNELLIFINDKLQKILDLSKITYPITGDTKVGLAGWKSQATFTDYCIKYADETPTLVKPMKLPLTETTLTSWDWMSTYDKQNNTLSIEIGVSDISKSGQILSMHETASADIYAETTVKVNKTTTSMWPRVGLRLINEAGDNVALVLDYDKEHKLLDVMSSTGAEINTQRYAIDSVEDSASKEGIKIAIAKVGDKIYFYVNDVLFATKSYEGFGVDDKVIAHLYSKGTESEFSNHNVKTDKAEIETILAACSDTFIADGEKSKIYFDIFNEENETEPKIITNEKGSWAGSSIVNWNGVAADKFYAEATVELTGNNNTDGTVASAGLVITSGNNRFFVLLSGDENEIIRLQCVSMTQDIFDGYNAEKYPNGKVYEYSGKVSLTGKVKLGVYRDGNELYIIVNDEIQEKFDLSMVTYPITGASMVGLTGWKSQAEFTEYSIKLESECPTLGNTFLLAANDSSIRKAVRKVVYSDANVAEADVEIKGASTEHGYLYFDKASTKVYAETNVSLTGTSGEQRVGFALKSASGNKVLGIYLHANADGDVDKLEIFNTENDESNADWKRTEITLSGVGRENIKLSVARQGDDLVVYVNDSAVITTLSNYATYQIGANEATYVGLNVLQGSAVFSDFDYETGDECEKIEDTVVSKTNAASTRNVTVVISDTSEEDFKVNMTGTSSKHGYLYFNGVSTKTYIETYVDITGTSGDQRTGFAIKDSNGNSLIGIYLRANGKNDVSHLDVFNLANDNSVVWNAKATKLSDVGRTGIKLAVLRDGDDIAVYINGTSIYTAKLSSFTGYPIAASAETYIGLNVLQGNSSFYNYRKVIPDSTIALAAGVASFKDATQNFVISSSNVASVTVNMKSASSKDHAYMYFGGTSTRAYAETYLDITGTSGDQRVGFALKSADSSAILGIYLHAKDTGNVDKLEIVNIDAHKRSAAIWPSNKGALSDLGRTSIKFAVLRDGDNLTIFVNDNVVRTDKLSNYTTYAIASDKETYIGLTTYQGSGTFRGFDVSEVYKSEVSKTVTSDITAVGKKNLFAETVLKTTATSGSSWPFAGLRLTNTVTGEKVDFVVSFSKSTTLAAIGIYAMEIDSDGKEVARQGYTYSGNLETDITTKGVKLAVYKQENTFSFYVNGVLAGTKTYTGFGADATVKASLYSKGTGSIFYKNDFHY